MHRQILNKISPRINTIKLTITVLKRNDDQHSIITAVENFFKSLLELRLQCGEELNGIVEEFACAVLNTSAKIGT